MKTIEYRGRRPLRYHQAWMKGGPYIWNKSGDVCLVEESDALVLTSTMGQDFVEVEQKFTTPKNTCERCGKVCKSKAGLVTHQKVCK